MTYKLELLESTLILLMFHISQLKKAVMEASKVKISNLDIDIDFILVVVLEDILSTIQCTHDLEVLVKWSTKNQESATWEIAYSIRKNFPDFSLEDKVEVMGGEGGQLINF